MSSFEEFFTLLYPTIYRYGELEGRALQQEVAGWSTGGKDTIEEIHSLASCVARYWLYNVHCTMTDPKLTL